VLAEQPRRQGLQATGTRTVREAVSGNGAFSTGSVGPRICTTGVPTSDATCIGPVSRRTHERRDVHRPGVVPDEQATAREERGEIRELRRDRSQAGRALGGRHDRLGGFAIALGGPGGDDRRDPGILGERAGDGREALRGVPLVGRRVARARVDDDRRDRDPKGREGARPRVSVHAEGAPIRRGVDAEEAHETQVALETAHPARLETREIGGEQPGGLAPEGPRVGNAPTPTARQGEQAALEDRVEVDHQIEPLRPEGPEEASQIPGGATEMPPPERLAQKRPGKDQHLVEPRLGFEKTGRRRLDQPGDARGGVDLPQKLRGGQRAHHVPHGPESQDQDAIRAGRALHRVADGDAEPRGGVGWSVGYSAMRAARILEGRRARLRG
jgi:hypothetical protein